MPFLKKISDRIRLAARASGRLIIHQQTKSWLCPGGAEKKGQLFRTVLDKLKIRCRFALIFN
jgi:hypothetical protein